MRVKSEMGEKSIQLSEFQIVSYRAAVCGIKHMLYILHYGALGALVFHLGRYGHREAAIVGHSGKDAFELAAVAREYFNLVADILEILSAHLEGSGEACRADLEAVILGIAIKDLLNAAGDGGTGIHIDVVGRIDLHHYVVVGRHLDVDHKNVGAIDHVGHRLAQEFFIYHTVLYKRRKPRGPPPTH